MNKPEIIAKRIKYKYIDNINVKDNDKLPNVRDLVNEYFVSVVTIVKSLDLLEKSRNVHKRQGDGIYAIKTPQNKKFIGLVGLSNDYEIMVRYMNGVDKVCKRYDYNLMIGNFYQDWSYELERDEIKSLIDRGCDAIVLIPTARTRKQLKNDYLNSEFLDFPIILLDTSMPEQHRLQITYNYKKECYELTSYLISKGYSKIVILKNSDKTISPHYNRALGYVDAMKDNGLYDPNLALVIKENCLVELKNYLLNNPCDAIISFGDENASEIISFLRENDFNKNKEIEVTGFDYLDSFKNFDFVTTNIDEVGAAEFAAETLLKFMQGEYSNNYCFIMNFDIVRKK